MALGIELVLIGALVAVLYFIFNDRPKYKNLPPGPTSLPLVGSLPFLTKKPHQKFSEWAAKYGPIMKVKLMNYDVVMISDPKLSREAFSNPLLLGKPEFKLFDMFAEGNHGIFSSTGDVWVEQRRFTLRQLRDFGFGKRSLQDLYLTEVTEFVNMMKEVEQSGKSVSLKDNFGFAAINSLWMIMTGTRFRMDDHHLKDMVNSVNDVFNNVISSPLAVFWPEMAQKIPKISGWDKLEGAVEDLRNIMRTPVQEHLKGFQPGQVPRDFIDAYLNEIEKTTEEKSSFHQSVGVKNLEVLIGDLFGAGTNTTAETLSFGMLYLCRWPEIQKKLQAEIDRVVGKSRPVTLEDRPDMPYTEAFIQETLRKSSIVPYGVFHSAIETTTLAGYTIPKDSWIGINMYHLHHDPKVWEDPMTVKPERFLNADGSLIKMESLIPFSVGKRMCIGEQLARDGVFLFLTNIFQRFQVKFDPAHPEPSLEGAVTLFADCEKYHVLLKDRIA